MREYIHATSGCHINIDAEEEVKELVKAGWPYALIKATQDEFDYALKLKSTDEVFFFRYAIAQECLQWVTIFPHEDYHDSASYKGVFDLRTNNSRIGWDRGLEIQVADIAWVTDAPFGS